METISKSDIDKSFGKILKEFRVKNHLTQDNLSEKLGISLKYISRIENGYSGIKTQTMINCMNLLGIEPNILFADFIQNQNVRDRIDLSYKISKLDKKDFEFLLAIVELLLEKQ